MLETESKLSVESVKFDEPKSHRQNPEGHIETFENQPASKSSQNFGTIHNLIGREEIKNDTDHSSSIVHLFY